MDQSKIYTQEGLLEVIDALPIAVAVIDQKRNVALANKMTLLFVNKSNHELIGHVGGEAFGCAHHDDVPEGCGFGPSCLRCGLRETVMDTMDNQKAHNKVETTMSFQSSGDRHLRISTLPMALNGENVVLLGVEDITEAKEHERIRMEKEKLEAVLETAGAVCHELSQPLMAVNGYAELLMMDTEKDSPFNQTLQRIMDQIDRMGKITRRLMSIRKYHTKDYLQGKIIDLDIASSFHDENFERSQNTGT